MEKVSALMMLRPLHFAFNEETAASNSFQQRQTITAHAVILKEFDLAVELLKQSGVQIVVQDDLTNKRLPDAVFLNNWFSTHEGKKIVTYPMQAVSRRGERRMDIIDYLKKNFGYYQLTDLSAFESQEKYLEGTGSIVFDHRERIAFASVSPRTNKDILLQICEELGYLPFVFESRDRNGEPVYHTNVIMSLGEKCMIVCFDSIQNAEDKSGIEVLARSSGRTLIRISMSQMECFAGNALFFTNSNGKEYCAISSTAWESLSAEQKEQISSCSEPLIANIPTIERIGGGSIRCMIAEIR